MWRFLHGKSRTEAFLGSSLALYGTLLSLFYEQGIIFRKYQQPNCHSQGRKLELMLSNALYRKVKKKPRTKPQRLS